MKPLKDVVGHRRVPIVHMAYNIAVLSRTVITQGASVGLLPRMDTLVPLEQAGVGEAFAAKSTKISCKGGHFVILRRQCRVTHGVVGGKYRCEV